jgi:hypothetical protein
MSKTVFILGAGASKEAGAPLMAEFLDVAHNLWKTGKARSADKDFSDVFSAISALQNVHSKSQLDIFNVESVFATFEMAKTLNKFPRIDIPLDNLIESMKIVILKTIEETLKLPVINNKPGSPIPYGEFSEIIEKLRHKVDPKHNIAIITFNYDLACDYALYLNGINVNYALGEENNSHNTLPFLKLHGSLNWAYCPELKKVVPWTMQAHFSKYRWDILPYTQSLSLPMMEHLKDFEYDNKPVAPEPVIVPPTWNKSELHRNLADVWSRAAAELSDTENIFIIGYSFPESDAFFKYLYALGTVGENLIKRIWVFNPDNSGLIEKRFASLLGPAALSRFKYYPETFRSAIKTINKEFPAIR